MGRMVFCPCCSQWVTVNRYELHMKERSTSTMMAALAGTLLPMQNLLEDFGCEFKGINPTWLVIHNELPAIDTTMDLDNTRPSSEPLFPHNVSEADIGIRFWTISDKDFEPDPTLIQQAAPSDVDQVIYDQHSEEEAVRAEETPISLEEQEYLAFLKELEYSEHAPHCLHCVRS